MAHRSCEVTHYLHRAPSKIGARAGRPARHPLRRDVTPRPFATPSFEHHVLCCAVVGVQAKEGQGLAVHVEATSWWILHSMTIHEASELGIAARLAKTTARKGCKAAGPRPGSGLAATCIPAVRASNGGVQTSKL